MHKKRSDALRKFQERLARVGTRSKQTMETYRIAVERFAEVNILRFTVS